MACYSPVKGFRDPSGRVIQAITGPGGSRVSNVTVSCGQCIGCRLERSRQWAVRITHEASLHERNSFITLTYSDNELPENQGLDVTHWQLFAKRVRARIRQEARSRTNRSNRTDQTFRFFHCGEYGETNDRMHLHACIFGQDWSDDRKLHSTNHQGDQLYTSERLDDLWGKGHCIIGELNFSSAAYVARYIISKQLGRNAEGYYDRFDLATGEVQERNPPYVTMSRRPGIGKAWIDTYMGDVYPSDEVILDGKRSRPPKYYDSQYESLSPLKHLCMKEERVEQGKKHKANNTPERLEVRRHIQQSRLTQLTRTL